MTKTDLDTFIIVYYHCFARGIYNGKEREREKI